MWGVGLFFLRYFTSSPIVARIGEVKSLFAVVLLLPTFTIFSGYSFSRVLKQAEKLLRKKGWFPTDNVSELESDDTQRRLRRTYAQYQSFTRLGYEADKIYSLTDDSVFPLIPFLGKEQIISCQTLSHTDARLGLTCFIDFSAELQQSYSVKFVEATALEEAPNA